MTPSDPPENTSPSVDHSDDVIGIALRWSLMGFFLIALIGGSAYFVLHLPAPTPELAPRDLADAGLREPPEAEIPQSTFTDITTEAGIHFVHENGAAGEKYLPETMGGGCAFLDYDGDGDQDILLVNSSRWPWDVDRTDPQASDKPPARTALYQNDGTGKFVDVSEAAGLDISCYGMGAAVGDYDNDGDVDVFISTLQANRLFRNEGGRFEEVTAEAGVAGSEDRWSSSCGWFDFDNDGDLDLFVCNYLNWSREYDDAQAFQLTGVGAAYGRPENFEGEFPYLYRNEGDGRFTEVAEQAGLYIQSPDTGAPLYKSLGVAFTDFDRDGYCDILVANDTVQNLLFHNQGDGTFQDVAVLAGIAFDRSGAARGAMGIDVADFRNNASMGVVIGNFANEMTALYVAQDDSMQFRDEAISTGLGPSTRLSLTFGVLFLDYDLDGRIDILAANGHLEDDIQRVQASQRYAQPPQMFWNCGAKSDTEFVPVPAEKCGEDLVRPMVGRGASYADIDNDGDLDVLLTAIGSPPRLLRNNRQPGFNWLRFKLIGETCNRDAIGAIVEVVHGQERFTRQVAPTRSYLSQVELPVSFGLGSRTEVDSVIIHWPGGGVQQIERPELNRLHVIHQSE